MSSAARRRPAPKRKRYTGSQALVQQLPLSNQLFFRSGIYRRHLCPIRVRGVSVVYDFVKDPCRQDGDKPIRRWPIRVTSDVVTAITTTFWTFCLAFCFAASADEHERADVKPPDAAPRQLGFTNATFKDMSYTSPSVSRPCIDSPACYPGLAESLPPTCPTSSCPSQMKSRTNSHPEKLGH